MESLQDKIKGDIQMLRSFGKSGEYWKNYAIADNVVRAETGDALIIDQDTRDRLLINGRQDAAHANLNTGSILKQLSGVRFQLAVMWLILLVLLAGQFTDLNHLVQRFK